ncbi:hypothetical protein KAZ93_03690 [Patescibacteria group bacterium]|nr:hypothetical protein [Patescibacteria group bacterium]
MFHNFPLSLELQYQTSPYKYIFSDSSPHTTAYVGDLEIKKELLLMKNIEELSHGEQEYLQKLNDEMAKNEAYIKMREAYSMYDI